MLSRWEALSVQGSPTAMPTRFILGAPALFEATISAASVGQ